MQPVDATAFKERMHELFEALPPGKPPSDKALALWWNVLKDHPFSRVSRALDHWSKTKGKQPAPAEINALCNEWLSDEVEERNAREKAQAKREFNGFIRSKSPEAEKFRRMCWEILGRPVPNEKVDG